MVLTRQRVMSFFCGLAGAWLLLCAGVAEAQPTAPHEGLRLRIEATAAFGGMTSSQEPLHAPKGVVNFYQRRDFALAWWQGPSWSPHAAALLKTIVESEQVGLEARRYHVQALTSLLQAGAAPPTEHTIVDGELLLTDAWLTLGRHLFSGHVSASDVDKDVLLLPGERDFAALLAQGFAAGDIIAPLRALEPTDPAYDSLVTALGRYRAIAAEGAWEPIPAGVDVAPGQSDPRLPAVRARLERTADLAQAPSPSPTTLDEALAQALSRFQARHGLQPTGALDSPTLRELNVPVQARVRTIELNLERWRWLPQDLGAKHIRVNIPSYQLKAVQEGDVALEMDVIVGRTYRRTPMFSSQVNYLVFNPTWTVPPNILAQDKLPVIKKDQGYLKRQNMVILSGWGADTKVVDPATIDWSTMTAASFNKRYRLQQAPGPNNALGQVKFIFPNQFSVYLHDTNARDLFSKEERSLSSGCIRVAKPLELATWLLGGQPEGQPAAMKRLLSTGKETSVILKEKVPVHLMYFTAWSDDGVVSFRRDLYERDERLAASLARLSSSAVVSN